MSSRITVRWGLGLVIGLLAVGVLAASAYAQTPTATPKATATPTATAKATGTPAPAKTGNAGFATDGRDASTLIIGLLAASAVTVVFGGRAIARRRR